MKEIKVLIQQLKNYPEDYCVYPTINDDENYGGLVILNKEGKESGFVRIGDKEKII